MSSTRVYQPPLRLGERILGIDPGLALTGFAVVEVGMDDPLVCEAGVLRGEGQALPDRLRSLYQGVADLIEQYHPRALAIEQLYSHYAHPQTAVQMAHARGAILLAAGLWGVPAIGYPATTIKKTITGNGRASKEQVQHALAHVLRLAAPPEPSDVADALAVALCHFHLAEKLQIVQALAG
jgi:crossover junction endodeoxyribonuclease RuvC